MGGGWYGSIGSGVRGTANDNSGNSVLTTDNEASPTAGPFGAGASRYILSGIPNGDFALAPLAPDSEITADNDLPYWEFTNTSGDAFHAYSEADPGQPSGRRIRIDMTAGSAGDECRLSNTIRVNGSRSRSFAYGIIGSVLTGSTVSAAEIDVNGQFLTADGSTVSGPISVLGVTTTSIGANTVFDLVAPAVNVPATAYLLRVDLTYRRASAATSTTETIYWVEARRTAGDGVLVVAELTTPSTYAPAQLSQTAGVLRIMPDTTAVEPPLIDLDSAGDSINFRNRIVYTTPSAQTITGAGTTITHNGYIIPINATGSFTLTSTPTIADGVQGQVIVLLNVDTADTITLQDQGTLASSGLRLSTATFAMGPRDSITLLYNTTIGDWVEIARTNVI